MKTIYDTGKRTSELLQDLKQLVEIPSVRDERTAGSSAPFGKEIRNAMDVFLQIAQREGFSVHDFDGYAVDAQLGEGDDYIGVLAHLDVVEAGERSHWHGDPFQMQEIDGMLCDRLANHYRLQIPDVEIRYLQVYFLALQNSRDLSEQEQQEARMLSDALLTSWSEQLHLPFDRDEALCQSVYDHLCPAIIRFRHGIPNENPLMQEIHTLYERTFQVARNSVSVIEEHFHCNVSDDEVGFLALHLAASLENMKQPLKTILVAHGGVGAGNLLRRKLSAQIPEIDIISQETFFSIYECDISDIDLIISTLELNLHTDVTILQVNSLLHDYDILRLKDVIREYYKVKNDPYNFKSAAQE